MPILAYEYSASGPTSAAITTSSISMTKPPPPCKLEPTEPSAPIGRMLEIPKRARCPAIVDPPHRRRPARLEAPHRPPPGAPLRDRLRPRRLRGVLAEAPREAGVRLGRQFLRRQPHDALRQCQPRPRIYDDQRCADRRLLGTARTAKTSGRASTRSAPSLRHRQLRECSSISM